MKIKNLLRATVLAAICSLAALPARAQNYFQVARGGTNHVDGTTTNTYTTYIGTPRARLVGVDYRFKIMVAGTDGIIFHQDGSLDGSTFINDALGTNIVTATGTTPLTNHFSFDAGANIAVRIRVENTGAGVVTNLFVAGTTKDNVGGTVIGGTFTGSTLAGNTTNSALTASLPVFTGVGKEFVSKSIANTKTALGIQSGSTKADTAGFGTNTFATAFSAAPIVVLTRRMNAFSPTNNASVLTSTTTNFTYSTGEPGTTNTWIAIGAP